MAITYINKVRFNERYIMVQPAEGANSTIKVKIAPLMGEVREFILAAGVTVGEALDNAGYASNSEVRVTEADGNSQTIADNASILEDGDVITVVSQKKIEAGL